MRESTMAPASIARIHQCCFDNLATIGTSPRGMYNFIRKNRLAIIRLVLNCQFYGEMRRGIPYEGARTLSRFAGQEQKVVMDNEYLRNRQLSAFLVHEGRGGKQGVEMWGTIPLNTEWFGVFINTSW